MTKLYFGSTCQEIPINMTKKMYVQVTEIRKWLIWLIRMNVCYFWPRVKLEILAITKLGWGMYLRVKFSWFSMIFTKLSMLVNAWQCLAMLSNACQWLAMLGLESYSRSLGMNSLSFLLNRALQEKRIIISPGRWKNLQDLMEEWMILKADLSNIK